MQQVMISQNLQGRHDSCDEKKGQLDDLVSRIDVLIEEHSKMTTDIKKLEKGVRRLRAQILVEINFCNYNVCVLVNNFISTFSLTKTRRRAISTRNTQRLPRNQYYPGIDLCRRNTTTFNDFMYFCIFYPEGTSRFLKG